MAIRRFGIHSAFASALLAFPITTLSAGDPALGAMLYVNPNGAPLGCANAACHGPNPAANMNGITRGADQPSLILNAINTRPEMMFLRTFINAAQAEHIAAYIANPNGLPTGTIALSNNALGFGNQSLSTTSPTQTVTVSNSGSNTVTLTAIAMGGTNPTEFARSGTCANGMALAAGNTCTIAATFTPTLLGSRNASVAIVHSGANSPLQIALSGNGVPAPGPVMSLSASSLTFAGQGTNTTSAVQTINLSNTGPLPLTLSGLTVGGANAAEFTRAGICASGTALATNQSCTVTIAFRPTALGSRTGSLNITSNAPGSPHSIALTGTGIVPAPAATLTSNSISFGNYVIGTTSPAKTITLTNTGSAPLTLTSITPPGTAFAHTTDCGASLAINASCVITATFSPVATGLASGTINIATNAIGSPHAISLSGNGFPAGTLLPAVTLSSTAIAFGAHSVNSASPSTTVTLMNTDLVTPLNISNFNLTGSNASDFSRAGTCSTAPVAPNGSCTLIMTFSPTGTGARAATLTLVSNALGHQSIALSGTGTIPSAPAVMLSAPSLTFSGQPVGTLSGQQAILVSNVGNATLPISTISANGDFGVTSNCGATLAPSTNCQIAVTFAPTATGARTGQVTIATGAAGSPHTVSVSGTGMPAGAVPSGSGPSSPSAGSSGGGGGGCTIGSRDDTDPILALMIFAAILGLRRRSRQRRMF